MGLLQDKVTLVTGGTSGIGRASAILFAQEGAKVALTGRRSAEGEAVVAEIVAAGGSAPIIIPCDLEQPDACDKIAAALTAEGVDVEFVVNNAGFGLFGKAVEMDRAEQLGIVAVNIRTTTDLSLRFSDSLIRHGGGILNVGSIAGFLPGPGMAVYYASKAYVLSLTEALRAELGPRGVRVTVVCPGPVPSEFQRRAGFAPGFDSAILNVSAADVALAAYRGLMANKRAVLPGVGIKIIPFLLRLFPRGFILAAVGAFQLRKR